MSRILEFFSKAKRSLIRAQSPPKYRPMLATLMQKPFSAEGWVFEPKLDGERCLAYRDGDRVDLLSPTQTHINNSYPEIVDALLKQPIKQFIVDGEIVAVKDAISNFSLLQRRIQIQDPELARWSGEEVFFYIFDVLYLGGRDVTSKPLLERKSLLTQALSFGGPLCYSSYREKDGEDFFEEVCKKGWQGIIAKRGDSKYIQAKSRDWLKFRCQNQQAFVIGGYVEQPGTATPASLLIGYHDDKENLVYAGRVATGLDEDMLNYLGRHLIDLKTPDSPFVDEEIPAKHVHWVRPELVVQVSFEYWTEDAKPRHPIFLGLRRDKEPEEVVCDRPEVAEVA